jgi:acetyl-CoA C-acetyltransferase
MYALIETAVRAAAGESTSAHAGRVAELWSRFSDVAAENPHAWIKRAHSAAEIGEPTPANRVVCAPYTKLLTANIQVNMASGLILASIAAAEAAGVPKDRWVFVHATAHAQEEWHVSERAELAASPAVRAAASSVLERCGLQIGDVAYVDLYSCFPSAVQIAARELGLTLGVDDPPPTVTGGLTFAGGPGNNYASHALATLLARVRDDPRAFALTTAVGWYLSKHALGVFSAQPPRAPFAHALVHPPLPHARKVVSGFSGRAALESHALPFDREGAPEAAIVSALTPAGERVLLRTEDSDTIGELLAGEHLGAGLEIATNAQEMRIAAFESC